MSLLESWLLKLRGDEKMAKDDGDEGCVMPQNEDPDRTSSDVIYSGIILAMSLALVVMWIEYRRLKNKYRGRKIAEVLTSPTEVKDHLQKTLKDVAEFVVPLKPQRFRKRDRVYFHSRQLARKVALARRKVAKNFLSYVATNSSDSSDANEAGAMSLVGPAEEYLEEDESLSEQGDRRWVPEELSYLLNSFHMFGNFDKLVFLELCRSLETVAVPAGQYLFKVGERDEFLHVVQSGEMNVHIMDSDGKTHTIKMVKPGEAVSSLLSFIDCLTGYPAPFKTVCCRAVTDSIVLKLPVSAFSEVFIKNPEMLVRVVQLIMARVQRVIFVALHQHLGLTSELIRHVSECQSDDSVSIGEELDQADFLDYSQSDSDDRLLNLAVKGFQTELDIDNVDFLKERIEIRSLSHGDVLMTEDSHNDAALIYILSGSLVLSQRSDTDEVPERTLYTAYRWESVGQLAMLTGEANFYSCKSKERSLVAILPRQAFFDIVCQTPEIVLSLAHTCICRLSSMVRQVDFALDWVHIDSGKALFRQNEPTDGTYIVLSGRLRSVVSNQGSKSILDEKTKGDMVGLVSVITETNRLSTVVAVRDSELCKVPSNLLNLLKLHYPVIVSRLITMLGNRLLHKTTADMLSPGFSSQHLHTHAAYNTVALYPSSSSIPLTAFSLELKHALTATASSVVRLSSRMVKEQLGDAALEPAHEFRLKAWLGQQEHRHRIVIYECDSDMTTWTSLCLRQADLVLVLVRGDAESQPVSPAERRLESAARRTRKELVLIHPESTTCPRGTREWLHRRTWVSAHFHLRAPARLLSKSAFNDYARMSVFSHPPDIHSDFSRLARHLCGSSVGVVLGGGGARGAAHVGMLKAVREAGIPVDKVGGVSIGAMVGGVWCESRDPAEVTHRARRYFDLLATAWVGPGLDFTYPYTSIFTGKYFNWTLRSTFGDDLFIEDLWLPFFCVTTDITVSRERVHTRGLFWKYCRASMSYAWLLPPLCDPDDGHLLMDGCYVNNVPGDVMAAQGCKYILAVDVTALDDRDLTNYGDWLSGWWVLLHKLNPFVTPLKIPDQSEIQLRLAFCSHHKNLEELKRNPNYEYIKPPIDKYPSGAFKLYDEIMNIGYHHGSTFFTGLRKAGEASMERYGAIGGNLQHSPLSSSPDTPPWFPASSSHLRQWSRHHHRETRRADHHSVGVGGGGAAFTDLAQIVARANSNSPDSPASRRSSNSSKVAAGGRLSSASPTSLRAVSSSLAQKRQQRQRRIGKQARYSVATPGGTGGRGPEHLQPDDGEDSDDTGIVL